MCIRDSLLSHRPLLFLSSILSFCLCVCLSVLCGAARDGVLVCGGVAGQSEALWLAARGIGVRADALPCARPAGYVSTPRDMEEVPRFSDYQSPTRGTLRDRFGQG
eukprot:1161220-Rhodomonas_salina.1